MAKKKTTFKFIEDATIVHGDFYDYSKVNYVGSGSKIEIVCKTHGSFFQTANKHLLGGVCPKCAKIKRSKKLMKAGYERFIYIDQN